MLFEAAIKDGFHGVVSYIIIAVMVVVFTGIVASKFARRR